MGRAIDTFTSTLISASLDRGFESDWQKWAPRFPPSSKERISQESEHARALYQQVFGVDPKRPA